MRARFFGLFVCLLASGEEEGGEATFHPGRTRGRREMGAEAMVVGPKKKQWGTWEELILGGAVLRHGTQDWNVVASELRARTLYPYFYTPEVRSVPLFFLKKNNNNNCGNHFI